MRLLITYDHHFLRAADGAVYVGHPMSIPGYRAWEPYLRVFEQVLILGRVGPLAQGQAPKAARADGPGVEFHDVPDYLGPWQYARRFVELSRAVRRGVEKADAYILKVPGALGQMARRQIVARGRPYAIEVISDPWDMYAPGAVPSVVRPLVRHRWTRALGSMCQEAAAVAYVTREALQRRYPPAPNTWSTFVSDVDLQNVALGDEELLRKRAGRWTSWKDGGRSRRLLAGFSGSFSQLTKAPDILLRAAAAALRGGLDFEIAFAGDGKYRAQMEALARQLGIEDRVRFLGWLAAGAAIQSFLDGLDLFVLPSRTEGLPRALVEAMARGCPCLGSAVGGIPELLSAEDLVPPEDVAGLAAKLREVLANPARLEQMARRNLARAQEYRPELLEERRTAFYQKVREQAADAR